MTNALIFSQTVKNILPEPFEWCEIPAGEVEITYGDWNEDYIYRIREQKTVQVESFLMAKYPITVAQYEAFVDDGGYNKPDFWQASIWQDIQSNKTQYENEITPFWKDHNWHKSDHPIIGIERYHAQGFAKWLSHKTGLQIVIPTEEQWQGAAQGHDNRLYPWGNEFNQEFANTFENENHRTTPVTKYPEGASVYDVMDMGGNVWEWTSSVWNPQVLHHGLQHATLRGGSWNNESDAAQTTYRLRSLPNIWDYKVGMRIACIKNTKKE